MKKATKASPTKTEAKTKAVKTPTVDLASAISGSGDGAKYMVVSRSQLKNAPYNPRKIDPVSAKRLRENIERTHGLINAPLWNIQTGNLISGHQRIAQKDLINRSDKYTLTVAVVDWPLEKEIEQNIALNSPTLAGQYDLERLDELLPQIDLANTGLDIATLELMHYDQGIELPDFFLTEEEAESEDEYDELVEDVEDAIEEADEIQEEEDAELKESKKIDKIKERKKSFAERQKFFRQNRTQARIVFPTDASRALFMQTINSDPDAEFIDGMELLKFLGIETEALEIIDKEMPESMSKSRSKRRTPAKSK